MNLNKDKRIIIENLAVALEEHLAPPEWAGFVKTGHGKDRPPSRDDWWSVRAASVLTKVERLGPVGVSKLSRKYSTRKNRGVRPEITVDASRNILRKILQQLESADLIELTTIAGHKGRVVTKKGRRMLNEAAVKVKGDSDGKN